MQRGGREREDEREGGFDPDGTAERARGVALAGRQASRWRRGELCPASAYWQRRKMTGGRARWARPAGTTAGRQVSSLFPQFGFCFSILHMCFEFGFETNSIFLLLKNIV